MVRIYKRKTNNKSWSTEVMAKAVASVLSGKMGYTLASRTFALPKTTLERKVKKARQCAEYMATLAKPSPTMEEPANTDFIPEVDVKYEQDDSEWITSNQNDNIGAVASTPAVTVTAHENMPMGTFHNNPRPRTNRFRVVEPGCLTVAGGVMPFTQYEQASCSSSFVTQAPMDAIEHLFLGFAKTIKSFSARRQVLTKMHVSQYIMEQELQQREEEEASHIQ